MKNWSKIVLLKCHFFSFLFFLRLNNRIWIILLSHSRRFNSFSSRLNIHWLEIVGHWTLSSTRWLWRIMSPWTLHNLWYLHISLSRFSHIFTLGCKIVNINNRTFPTIFCRSLYSIIFSILYFFSTNLYPLCSFYLHYPSRVFQLLIATRWTQQMHPWRFHYRRSFNHMRWLLMKRFRHKTCKIIHYQGLLWTRFGLGLFIMIHMKSKFFIWVWRWWYFMCIWWHVYLCWWNIIIFDRPNRHILPVIRPSPTQ